MYGCEVDGDFHPNGFADVVLEFANKCPGFHLQLSNQSLDVGDKSLTSQI
jgi:hypothetical protein